MKTKLVEVGTVVYDRSYGMTGIVVEKNPVVHHTPDDGLQTSTWDWGILYEDGELGYADNLELEIVEE